MDKEQVIEIVRDYKAAISGLFDSAKIYLYGSYSKGNAEKAVPKIHVSVVNKKNSCDGFNFDDATIVGNLMRTSLLPAIYKRIMDNWVDINDKKNLSTNVLFIPDILVYLDKYTGEVLRYPYKVNLLLIAEKSGKICVASSLYALLSNR